MTGTGQFAIWLRTLAVGSRAGRVLISPYALAAINKESQQIIVDLTKKQIEDSPSLDTDKPVSRQFETSYYGYYGWPIYWGRLASMGLLPLPGSG